MRFCDFEVGRVEALGQPVRDRLEEGHGICGTALIAQQPGEARGGGQFPGEGTLPAPNRAPAGSDPRPPPRLRARPAAEAARL